MPQVATDNKCVSVKKQKVEDNTLFGGAAALSNVKQNMVMFPSINPYSIAAPLQ